jgi:signal transduction histidine kinase/CheY-like chemotaxis protein/ligand-binding sensor domain-containing protein
LRTPLTIGIFAVLALSARAESGCPVIYNFSAHETGNSVECWTTIQDSRGFLYFGCDTVLEYDGERWSSYPIPGSNTVRALANGQDGRIWVGASNELGYFDRVGDRLSPYHSLIPELPGSSREFGDVWMLAPRGNGAVFVSKDSVMVWDGFRFALVHVESGRRLGCIEAGGQIFISSQQSGLWRLEGNSLRPFLSAEMLGHAGVISIERNRNGWLLCTSNGLLAYDGTAVSSLDPSVDDFVQKNILTSALRMPDDRLLLGTVYGGIAVISRNGRIERTITTDDGLPTKRVYSLFCASDRSVWATTSVGITRILVAEGVSLYDSKTGLAGKPCLSIAQRGSEILTATEEGIFGLETSPGDDRNPFHVIDALSTRYQHLQSGPGGSAYAAGFKHLVEFDGKSVKQLYQTAMDITVMHQGERDDSLLLGDESGVVRLNGPGRPDQASASLVRLPDSPASLAEDAEGNVWVGTSTRGAFLIRGPANSPSQASRVSGGNINLDFGRALVANIGSGVGVFTDHGASLYAGPGAPMEVPADLPATVAQAVSNPDPSGGVWIAFESPFADGTRVPVVGRLALGSSKPEWKAFGIPGLVQIGDIRSLFVDSRGIVWLGGLDGLLRLDPSRLRPTSAPNTPYIRASVGFGASLPEGRSSVNFDFSTAQFGLRDTVRFETKLSGAGDEWSAPSNVSYLRVAGLRSSTYELAVRSVNDAGMVSSPSSWVFTVLPPWYRTMPALFCFGLLVAAGGYGGFQWRLAYLRRQNARLEQLVQRKTEQLEKANVAKSEFLANMSHEIRNPISGILGLSIAFEETALDERQRYIASSINSCATLLATLVDDVLDFSKIEAGKIELRSAPFSPKVLLDQCVSMMSAAAKAAGVQITVFVDPKVPDELVGDSGRVQQIILNYVTNALKFGAGKPIVVAAQPGFHDRVRFLVRDLGPGMTEAEASTLFTKFTRLDSARAGNIRGTGLGLAVCRLLAGKMGGRVGVDSKPGEGSTFWAEIPFVAAAPRVPAGAAAEVARSPLRALIVEDIDYNVVAMQAMLRKLNIQSDVVNDGLAALDRLKNSFYDVAFLDWNLPGLIGTEVATRYRAIEPSTRRTIIIATTAHSSNLNREACLQAGMDAFISKPITPAKIAGALKDLGGPLRTAASIEVRSQGINFEPPGEIDLEMLAFLGSETLEGLAGQIERFLGSFDTDRENARRIVQAGDRTEIHRIAHRLLSHCSVVKYEALTRIASELQKASAQAPQKRLEELLAEFEQEFVAFRYKLESIRTSTGPA